MGREPIRLHLATGNAHKVEEFRRLADASPGRKPGWLEIVPVVPLPPVVEDTGTFGGNARKKAWALRAMLPEKAWIVADDSGVCVEALDGAPGVESAYFAGPEHDSAANLRKLVEVMRPVPAERRAAYFVCVLHLVGPGGGEQSFEGRCHGRISQVPAGGAGFGYDPLFVPDGYDRTYAELTEEQKNKISHRGVAWLKLASWLGQRTEVRRE